MLKFHFWTFPWALHINMQIKRMKNLKPFHTTDLKLRDKDYLLSIMEQILYRVIRIKSQNEKRLSKEQVPKATAQKMGLLLQNDDCKRNQTLPHFQIPKDRNQNSA